MPDEVKEPVKGYNQEPVKKEKKKGIFGKLKEGLEDREEQMAILSTFVRLGILIWSGGILTLAYIKLPCFRYTRAETGPDFHSFSFHWSFS